jgi:hypothetical protein
MISDSMPFWVCFASIERMSVVRCCGLPEQWKVVVSGSQFLNDKAKWHKRVSRTVTEILLRRQWDAC